MAGKINKGKVIAAAQKFVQKGQHDKAIREYSKVVEEDPRDVRIWLKIGDLYAKKGAHEQAVDTYLKVAEFYSEQGFYLKAVAVYKQILKLNPALVDVNLRLAELYKQLGLLNDAMQQYEVVSAYFHQAGRTKDALAALRQIVDLDPENVASRIKLAELYSKEQMRAEAVEEFAKAADFLRAQSRVDDFIKVAERLIYHQADNLPITKELAGLYLKRQDPRRALQKLQIAFKADPRAEDTLEMLAQAFRDLGQVQKTVSVWRELAQIHVENGQIAKQQELLRRILELAPDDAEAKQGLQQPEQTGAPRQAGAAPRQAGAAPRQAGAPRQAAAPPPPPPPLPDGGQVNAGAPPPVSYAQGGAPPATPPAPGLEPLGSAGYGDEAFDQTYQQQAPASLPSAPAWDGQPAADPQGHGFEQPAASAQGPAASAPGYGAYEASQGYEYEAAEEFSYDTTTAPSELEYQAYDSDFPPQDGYGEGAPGAPANESVADEVARVLTEADVYIKYGLHDKAADHLRQVFARDPDNVEVRLRLKDLHAQLGRYSEAALELYAVGRVLAASDPRAAAQYLNEALELDPQNSAARQLLAQLERGLRPQPGYQDDTFSEVDGGAIDLDADDIVEEIPIESSDLLEGDASVPSAPGYAPNDYGGEHLATAGSGVIEVHGETTDTLGRGTPSSEVIPLPADGSQVTDAQRRMQQEEESTTTSLEDDLEEADFFIQQSLFAEARTILDELLTRYPGHPLVEAKIADIDHAMGAAPIEEFNTDHGGSLTDLANELAESVDDLAAADPSPAANGPTSGGYSVEDVFDDIKRSVDSQVSEEDSDTHYDLGIAYREMGLLDDAIAEFKVAMRSREKEVLCHMMIGLCCSEKDMVSEAISQFKTGLYVEGITERETIALYFELGQAYEKLDDLREALYYYEKVAKKDPRFRDVDRHVERLRRATQGSGDGSPAAGPLSSPGGGGGAPGGHHALSDETDVF